MRFFTSAPIVAVAAAWFLSRTAVALDTVEFAIVIMEYYTCAHASDHAAIKEWTNNTLCGGNFNNNHFNYTFGNELSRRRLGGSEEDEIGEYGLEIPDAVDIERSERRLTDGEEEWCTPEYCEIYWTECLLGGCPEGDQEGGRRLRSRNNTGRRRLSSGYSFQSVLGTMNLTEAIAASDLAINLGTGYNQTSPSWTVPAFESVVPPSAAYYCDPAMMTLLIFYE